MITTSEQLLEVCELAQGRVSPDAVLALCLCLRRYASAMSEMCDVIRRADVSMTEMASVLGFLQRAMDVELPDNIATLDKRGAGN